jgi:hypothetical protein
MLAHERVFRVSIMIERDRFPLFLVVTFLALRPKVGSVNVVLLVAGIAIGGGLIFVERTLVASVAFRLPVIALQRISGITIVLKEHMFPVPFGVTTFAHLAETAPMLVVLLVAGIAVDRSLIRIQVSLVAGLAFGRDMPSPQRVLGMQVMIERDGLPIVHPMARFAFLSVSPFMLVVFLVTGITIHWGVFECRRQMAFLTIHLGMLSHQWEARLVVVERRLLP